MRFIYLLISGLFLTSVSFGQVKEQTGWLVFSNSIKLNKHFSTTLDVQFRSADNLEYVRTFLFRPGVSYSFNKKNNVAVGYLLGNSYSRLLGAAKNQLTEHRIWEQFVHTQAITKTVAISHRFRLEQRFIEKLNEDVFAQRFRYSLRAVLPLVKQDSSFHKGPYAGLQNELLLNVQNKEKLNGSLFDQNRAYAGLGYRFSSKLDVELGYLNQYIHGSSVNTSNNVFQLTFSTRF
ncbi:MAG: hypothetical protein K0S09_1447 [Sphingobacteriaceae bacterium]|jgi:hypothetical protein|nr:hypothetical protein [Sphingobacteriaceae bacterium]